MEVAEIVVAAYRLIMVAWSEVGIQGPRQTRTNMAQPEDGDELQMENRTPEPQKECHCPETTSMGMRLEENIKDKVDKKHKQEELQPATRT